MDLGAITQGAIVVGSGLLAGKAAKIHAKKKQKDGKPGHHQVTAPVAAVGAPAVIATIAGAAGIDLSGICRLVEQVCANPALAAAGLGGAAVWVQSVVRGSQRLKTG